MMSRTTILLIAILSACLDVLRGDDYGYHGQPRRGDGRFFARPQGGARPVRPGLPEPLRAAIRHDADLGAGAGERTGGARPGQSGRSKIKPLPRVAAEKPAEIAPSDAAATPDNAAQTAPAPPQPELSPAMVAVRDRLRRTLAGFSRVNLNTQENTATELMQYCLAFGCQSEVHLGNSAAKMVNGITCLCWNYPCAGFEPLTISQGHIAARLGYGLQEHPAQLLAVLALSRVPPTYPDPRGRRRADGGRPGAARAAQLPRGPGPVAAADRPVVLRRRADLEERSGRGLVARTDGQGGTRPTGSRRHRRRNVPADGAQLCPRPACQTETADRRPVPPRRGVRRQVSRNTPWRCRTATAVGARRCWPPRASAATPRRSCTARATCWSGS